MNAERHSVTALFSCSGREREALRPALRMTLLAGILLLSSCASRSVRENASSSRGMQGMEFGEMPAEMERKFSGGIKGDKPLRVAVLTFKPTGKEREENAFGEYLSESVTSALNKNPLKFRLFERNRLDMILRENQLDLSGLISAQEARRIGELAPVDGILSGTYTRLEDFIDMNSRLIDAVTGEIILAYAARILLDRELRALFREETMDPVAEDRCGKIEKKVNALLKDLSTPDKVKELVWEAKKAPFEKECARVHYAVMRHFKQYGVDDRDYEEFLMASVAAIPYPSEDSRAADALKFLARQERSGAKWKLCLETIAKSGVRTVEACLSPFVNYAFRPDELKQIFGRVDGYFSLIKKGKAGLPKPLTFNQGFFEMLRAADYTYATNHAVSLYCYREYRADLLWDEAAEKEINSFLTRAYMSEKDLKQKAVILDLLSESFNRRRADEKLADDMFQFALAFTRAAEYLKKNPEEAARVPKAHLAVLVKKCAEQFCKVLPLTRFGSAREERVNFCLENNLECPGAIPSPEECAKQLSSGEWTEKTEAARLLSRMGIRAKTAESALIKALEKRTAENQRENTEVQRFAIIALGNIRTSDPKALKLLVDNLGSLEYNIPTLALESLAAIGKPAVPHLIAGLKSEQGSVQYKSAKALGLIGRDARTAKPALKELLKSGNRDVEIMAAEALEQIGE